MLFRSAERHAERVMDGQTIAAGLAGKVGIFRKLLIQFRFGRRDLAGRERNAIGKTDHALGHRTQVVRHVRAEDDSAERRPAFRLIIAPPIVLEDKLAALAERDEAVEDRLVVLAEQPLVIVRADAEIGRASCRERVYACV